jgi:hypothetical protein
MLVMEQVVLTNHVAFVVKKENRVSPVNWRINALARRHSLAATILNARSNAANVVRISFLI